MSEAESFTEKTCPKCEGFGKVMVRTKAGHGRRARTKGKSGELKIAKILGKILGVEYKALCRTPNSGAFIERSDLRMSDEVRARFPVYIEVKNREIWTFDNLLELEMKWVGFEWLKEATEKLRGEQDRKTAPKLLLPVVVLMKNYREPLILWNSTDAFGDVKCLCLRVGMYRIAKLEVFAVAFLNRVALTFAHENAEETP